MPHAFVNRSWQQLTDPAGLSALPPPHLHHQRNGAYSVQEHVCLPLLERFGTESYKFHTAGREDMDVRMLGTGRPFAIEVCCRHAACLPLSFGTLAQFLFVCFGVATNTKLIDAKRVSYSAEEYKVRSICAHFADPSTYHSCRSCKTR